LIIVSPHSFLNRILLRNRLMVLIGLISYPLYLWHWPLLSYLAIMRHGVPNFMEIWAALVVAVVLSWLTYRFIEIPLRRKPTVVPKRSFGLMTVCFGGMFTAIWSGVSFRLSPEIPDLAQPASQNKARFRDH